VRRELSSKLAPVYRWVIPGLLTVAAVYVVWRYAIRGEPDTGALVLAWLTAAGCVLLARVLDRAKRVWIEDNKLIINDFRRTAAVDLSRIASVRTTPLFKPDRIVVRFSEPTIFGDKIVFYPRVRWARLTSAHPVARELIEMTGVRPRGA